MRRGCMLFVLFFMNFPLPANAGEEFGRCNASIMTPELVATVDQITDVTDEEWPGYLNGAEIITQGVVPRLRYWEGSWLWIPTAFRGGVDDRIADCRDDRCGGPNEPRQVCYSRLEAFTDASTQGGEQCSSDADILPIGGRLQRDQTWWMLQIDRSDSEETKYCQIEIKTLASGQVNPQEPPGTGELRCVGLKPGDPCSGPVNGLPDIIQPGDEIVVDGDLNGLAGPASSIPALPNLALAVLAGVMGWLGIARSRRRRALR